MKFRIMSSIAAASGSLVLLLGLLKLMVGRRHPKRIANERAPSVDSRDHDR
jgi:hypothetical protein